MRSLRRELARSTKDKLAALKLGLYRADLIRMAKREADARVWELFKVSMMPVSRAARLARLTEKCGELTESETLHEAVDNFLKTPEAIFPNYETHVERRLKEKEKLESRNPNLKLFADHLALMENIRQIAGISTTARYVSLGWSSKKGVRIKNELVDLELISVNTEAAKPKSGRPKELLSLTEKGLEMLKDLEARNDSEDETERNAGN